MTGRTGECQTQMEVVRELNIIQCIISRVWSRIFRTELVDAQLLKGDQAAEDRFLSLSVRKKTLS